jgi:hypothetical protein
MPYPVMQWFPQEGGTAVYAESREVNGEMWMVTNATYNTYSNQWLPVDPTRTCRALVSSQLNQTTAFRTSPVGVTPCVWTQAWAINDTGVATMTLAVESIPLAVDMSGIGIYNVCAPAYGMVAGVNTPTQAAANTVALQAACNAAATNSGAVFIPSSLNGDYYVNPGVVITTSTRTFAMFGTTDKAQLHVPSSSGGGTLLTLNTTGSNLGAISISDLRFTYDVPLTGTALLINGGEDIVIRHCIFNECPVGVSTAGLDTQIENCQFNTASQSGTTQIQVGVVGNEANVTNILDCFLFTQPNLNNTGLVLARAVEFTVTNTSFQQYDNCCIQMLGGGQGTTHGSVIGCQLSGKGTVLWMQPGTGPNGTPSATRNINDIRFVGCLFRHGTNNPGGNSPGVYIDSGGGPTGNCAGIEFADCVCDGFYGAGYQVNVAGSVSWDGGRATGNNLGNNGQQANISIIGAATKCYINGTICRGAIGYESGTAPYGIFLAGGCTNIYVRGADVGGCTTAGMTFSSPGANIQITNCPGYNDQGTLVTATAPAAGTYAPAQFGTTPYYGPVQVSLVGASTISVGATNQVVTGKTQGDIYLMPGGADVLSFTGTPSAFVVIGK